jgi:thiol-disulfide isomerase/thioredoxin
MKSQVFAELLNRVHGIFHVKIRQMIILCATVVLLAGCSKDDEQEADVFPSYKLEVGQVLTYEGSSKFEDDDGDSYRTTTKSQIWVTRRNQDGSFRLVARNLFRYKSNEEEIRLAIFDLHPNGKIDSGQYFVVRNEARSYFIRLPADPNKFRTTWETFAKEQDQKHVYSFNTQSRPHKGQWVFNDVMTSQMNEIYGFGLTSRIHFNAGKGLIEKIEHTYSQNYIGTGFTKLKGVKKEDADFVNRLAADTETYFNASNDCSKFLLTLAQHPNSLDAGLTEAKKFLLAAKDRISHPIVTEQLDKILSQHDGRIDYLKRRAKEQSAVLNQPSPRWETTDFKGRTYSIDSLRGKVVLLDFWYRGCGWCIRAMPQVKEVAAYFENQDVAVLGMNTDRDPNDADFVIKKMGLNYPNLKARDIPEKYGVRGYPTLIVIDPSGIVREFHVGYSPDLRENVISSVEKLLKPKPNESIDPNRP